MKKTTKRQGVIKTGSQTSEPIELTHYTISHKRGERDMILLNTETGNLEWWTHSQDAAGYVIRIGDKNYEFINSTP